MRRRAVVLVALDEDRVVLEDEETRCAIAREVVVDAADVARVVNAQVRLGARALELPHAVSRGDDAMRVDLVPAADQPHEAARLGHDQRTADRIALRFAQRLLVRRCKQCSGIQQRRADDDVDGARNPKQS